MLEKMLANIQKPTSELIIIRIFTQDNPSVHGGRKPECPEKTLEVSLRVTQTQSTYNVVVEVEGVIDVHYASLTSQGVQHRVSVRWISTFGYLMTSLKMASGLHKEESIFTSFLRP